MRSKLKILKAAALMGVAAFSSALSAEETKDTENSLKLVPSGPWNIEFAADSCRLSRLFGEGGDQVAFFIERYIPGDAFHMVVAGPPLNGSRFRNETKVQFGPVELEREYEPMVGSLNDYKPALIGGLASFDGREPGDDPEPDEPEDPPSLFVHEFPPEREAAIEWVSFHRRGGDRVELALPQFGAAMKAMRDCTEELLTHWDIDVEAHRTLQRAATPANNPGDWMNARDYPTGLLRGGYQGIVRFRLSVNEAGEVTECHIQDSTRPAGFDTAVCEKISRRAKFEPALDKDSKPIKSFYRNTVRFEIPR